LLVLPRLDNVDNLGQLLRTAVALGMEAVLVGQGPSPFERRTIRVSMGAAWRIPIRVSEDLPSLLARWKAHEPATPSEIIGAALVEGALSAGLWVPTPRTALVLGPEDRGLDRDWLGRCDRHVVIPMAKGMDSLNVAAAGAILMFRMMQTEFP
jgi:tRNA G18 (ribose-2'-O)-methylase SpoU